MKLSNQKFNKESSLKPHDLLLTPPMYVAPERLAMIQHVILHEMHTQRALDGIWVYKGRAHESGRGMWERE